MNQSSENDLDRIGPTARLVLERRYLRRDETGRVLESPQDMFWRVASTVAEAEHRYGADSQRWAERFYDLMIDFRFLPNSPTLMNAGRSLGQLSACFVLPVEDSIESIFNAVRDTALIHKSGGGTGFSFSRLRPAGDVVRSTLGRSSGPISFMRVFDVATETVKQGGVRRGANMGVLSVEHPDILEFIELKSERPGQFQNFNLSVAVTDRFMEAALGGAEYDLIDPKDGRTAGRLMARNVLGRMAESAWRCGDPGVMFIDTVNRHNPLPGLGPIETTNPCGEQPLAPYESCNLGSINLDRFGGPDGFDYPGLAASVHTAVRFLDDVIDVNRYPLDRIAKVSRANRKIGLGVMGLADALIRMGIDYASPEAEAAGGQVMAFVQDQAHRASAELAEVRGDFPHFRQSVHHDRGVRRMRNATVTTVAPTGSLSLIAGCSPGIEPLFALSYRRKMLGDTEVVQIHEGFEAEARRRGVWSDQLADHLETHGHLEGFEDLPEDMKRRYRTAHQIDPERHLAIQAAFQAHTDNAVSKTVNLAPNAEVRTVADVFVRAWQRGLKGVTVYRSGCRGEQVVRWGEDGPEEVRGAPTCPECGLTLNSEGGCWHCPSCGRSGCA